MCFKDFRIGELTFCSVLHLLDYLELPKWSNGNHVSLSSVFSPLNYIGNGPITKFKTMRIARIFAHRDHSIVLYKWTKIRMKVIDWMALFW